MSGDANYRQALLAQIVSCSLFVCYLKGVYLDGYHLFGKEFRSIMVYAYRKRLQWCIFLDKKVDAIDLDSIVWSHEQDIKV